MKNKTNKTKKPATAGAVANKEIEAARRAAWQEFCRKRGWGSLPVQLTQEEFEAARRGAAAQGICVEQFLSEIALQSLWEEAAKKKGWQPVKIKLTQKDAQKVKDLARRQGKSVAAVLSEELDKALKALAAGELKLAPRKPCKPAKPAKRPAAKTGKKR